MTPQNDIQISLNIIIFMLPAIDQEQLVRSIVHPIDSLDKVLPEPQRKKTQTQWNDKMSIVGFSLPVPVKSQSFVKVYKIRIVYQNEQGKQIPKTIFFGDQSDYVFNKDNNKRVRRLLTMKHLNNPLHPNYWKALLLNKYETMEQGLQQFMHYFCQNQKMKLNGSKKVYKSKQSTVFKPSTLVNMMIK